MDLLRTTVLSVALMLVAPTLSTAGEVTAASGGSISGMWWVEPYTPDLIPADGSPVPYTPAAKAEHDKNVAAIAAGTFKDPALDVCLLQGLPRAMISAYPIKIVQHDRSVTFIHEQNHAFWHAVFGAQHPQNLEDIDPAFMGGDSIARWDGGTLVIDTVDFKGRSFLDETGMPHTDALHVSQRLRKIDHGAQLEDLITVDDRGVFTHLWTARRTYDWRPDAKIMEYVCGDLHRALTGDRAQAVRLPRKPA